MNRFAPLLLAVALTGCATFDRNEIASIRNRGVSPRLVEKLDRGRSLSPTDVIELHRYRVPDPWVIRQLEDHDVDSLVTRSDVTTMRRAGVSPAVIDATLHASDRFHDQYRYGRYSRADFAFGDPYGGYYDPGFGYGGGYGYGPGYGFGYGADIVIPFRGGHHHHGR